MFKYQYLILGIFLLNACAQLPVQSGTKNSQLVPGNLQEPVATPTLPNVELTDELLYDFLLSEIAYQRGFTALAAEHSAALASKSRDPRLAKRAAQLAMESGQQEAAITAIKDWQELEPDSTLAMRMLAAMQLRGGHIVAARAEMIKVLKAEESHIGMAFLQTYQMLVPYPDAAAALQLMQELALPYPNVAEAHWGVAQLAQASGQSKLALAEIRQVRSLRPEWDIAVAQEAHLLLKSDPAQGLEVLRSYLDKHPAVHDIRLQYARALLDQKQYKPAREQFQRLSDENPDNPDMAYAIALISIQMNDLVSAEAQLKQTLVKGMKDLDTVQYYLGQLSEAKNDTAGAIANYREVKGGEYLFPSKLRIAHLLGKNGQLDQARQELHDTEASNEAQQAQLVLVEAQILREADQFEAAYELLDQGLAQQPEDQDLLYGTAMLADKLGKQEIFEKLMRKLIQINPGHAQAHNALGYSLLDRNERLAEAMQLVEKALQLAPDDHAIMDSVGWGYYRTGKLAESITLLRRAYTDNPDPEIAAHLGEVLWVSGEQQEARTIWQESLDANPGNALLHSVMERFMP